MKRLTGMRVIARAGVSLLGLAAVALLAARPPAHAVRTPMVAPHHLTALERLNFEPNRGQAPASTRFVAHGPGYGLLLNSREAELVLHSVAVRRGSNAVVRFTLAGARDVAGAGLEPRTGYSNYLIGRNRAKWLRRVPWYGKVRFHDVYPGIDVVYYGRKGELEYDLVAAPGADPGRIRLHIEGASRIRLTADGDLELGLGPGTLRIRRPVMYQMIGGARRPVSGGFVLRGHDVAFRVAQWDRAKSLIIDPVLLYSTYLGGSGADRANGIAVDSTGAAYVTGLTASTDFPTVTGSAQTTSGGGSNDVFVSKLNPGGTALVYSTYLGGSGDDEGNGIAIDSSNAAYITGLTASSNFPVTPGAAQATNNGGTDAFVAKLSADGTTLVYSTCLGGSGTDQGNGIAVDTSGNAYVTGSTTSANFPVVSAYQSTLGGGTDAFMTVVNATGSAFTYSSYLGGSGNDIGNAITWGSGGAYFTGTTGSTDLPTTHNSISGSNAGGTDAFVANFGPGSGGNYVTYIGGSGNESGKAIVLGGGGGNKVYIAGFTTSSSFANSNGTKIYGSLQGSEDAFVAEVNPGGAHAYFISYLGGTGAYTAASGMAVDSSENIYVTGIAGATTGANFQVADATYKAESGGDAFVAELTGGQGATSGHAVAFSYFGGGSLPTPRAIALDSSNNIYLAGDTTSSSFPVTSGAYQTTAQGADDAFVTKLALGAFGVDPASVTFPGTQGVGVASTAQTVTITNQNPTSLTAPGVSVTAGSSDFSETNTCTAAISPGDSCTISVVFTPTTGGTRTGTLSVTSGSDTQTIPLKGTGSPVSLSPTSLDFGNQTQGVASSAKPVTLTNNDSTNALSITSIAASGDFSATNTCGSSVAASGTCTVSVTFTPTATGARSGALTVVDGDGTQTVALSGTGTAAGSASLSVSTLDLGSEAVNQTSTAKTVTLTNGGTSALSITSVATTGDFAQTNTCGSSVAASGTCTISVTFTPTATGARSGTLTVTDGAGTQTATLNGTGTQSGATLSASTLTFTSTAVGQKSSPQSVTMTNSGSAPLNITGLTPTGDFALDASSTCSTSTAVAVNGTCTVAVVFQPTAAGARTGSLAIADDAPNSPQSLTLSGTGVAPQANLSASSLDLGSEPVGQTSAAKMLTLSNPGTVPLAMTSITTSGDFGQSNTCGTSVVAGQSCTISVTFTPTAAGARSGNLTVVDGAGTQTAALSGVAPEASLSASSLDLGSATVGQSSSAKTITLSNPGTVALPVSSITTSGDFSQTNTCGTSVAAGQSCTISVVFTPTASGARSGTLTVADGAGTQSAALSGVAPEASLSATSLNLGSAAVGQTSTAQTVTLSNPGTVALPVSSITTSGDFAQTNTCGASVAAGASCTLSVTFTPTAAGARSGTLTIVDGAGTQTVTLSGVAPQVSLSVSSLDLGSTAVGQPSAPQSATLDNTGTVALPIGSIAATGDFSETNTCGTSLAAGQSCTITVVFTPAASGTENGALTLVDGAGTQVILLTGTAATVPAPQVALSATTLSFGSVLAGESSSQTVTLTNGGTAALSITDLSATGDFSQTNNCTANLAAGQSCSITVSFTPTATGTRTGTLTLSDNAGGGQQFIALSGTGEEPGVSLSASTLSFGSTVTGATSAAQTVTLMNQGSSALNFTSIAASGDFSQTNTCGTSLAVGASCTLSVTFTPTAAGTRTGALTISDDASGGQQFVALSGIATAPGVTLKPSNLTFGSTVVGSASDAQTVTLANNGSSPLVITSITAGGDFSETNNCPASVAAGASCSIAVTFQPLAVGTRTGAVAIVGNAGTQIIALSGSAASGGSSSVLLSPTSLAFGSLGVGAASTPESVSISNNGTLPLSISALTTSGDFSQTNNCPATLNAGSSCSAQVSFTPTATGDRTGTLVIYDSADGGQQVINLSGSGSQAGIRLSPSNLIFGSQSVGSTSNAQTVVLTNSGSAAVTLSGITASSDFQETDNCPASLDAGKSCNINVSFAPVTSGARSGNVVINNSAGTAVIGLSGIGITPGLQLAPATLAFGSVPVNTDSNSQTVTLTNVGATSLSISGISTDGDFTEQNDCGTTLAAGASCTVNAVLTPTVTGQRTGNIIVQSNASGGTQVVALSGSGIAPGVTLNPTSLFFGSQPVGTTSPAQTITVSNAGSKTLNISGIAAAGDFSETNTCGATLASGASCTVSVTLTPSGIGTRTGTVTISDDAPGGAQVVTLNGAGTPFGIRLTPATLNFGSQPVGSTTPSQTVTLTNGTPNPLTVIDIGATGNLNVANDCGASVAVGASCTLSVSVTPSLPGTVTGSIVLDFASAGTSSTSSAGLQRAMRATAHATSSSTGPAQALVAVTGDGTKSGLLLTPSTLAFGSQAAGTTSDAQNVVVTNSSGKTMGIMSITPSANFTESDDCGKFLASQVSCTVKISFTPPAIGNYTGSVSIADDNGVQNIVVSGSGIAEGLKVSPSNLTFGTTIVGLTSGAQTVTFSNSGSAAFPIDAIDTSGDFTGGNNCGTSLAAGGSCTLTVAFAPAAAGTRTGTLTIQSGGSAAILVPLQGTGSKPLVTISPNRLSFPDQVVGTSSATQTITLSNAGTGPVVLNSIVADGDFTQTNNCGQQLAGGTTCAIAVTFTPQANGQRTGDVTVSDDAGLQQTTMSGNGSGSPLTISASTLVFPLQMVTIPSAAENVVLTNTGSSALAVSGIQVGGDYAQTNTCGASIAAGASCTVQVTFTPTAIGNRNSTLTLTDSAPASPQSLPILGSGMDLGLSSPDTAGKTVNAGGVADYTAVLTPLGGFTGPVKLACSGNPLHSSCVLGTNQVTMGIDPQNVKVSVITVGPPTASRVLPPPVSTLPSPLGGLIALGLIPLLLLGLMLVPGGRRRRALVLVAGVALLAFSLAGCGNDHDADDPTGPAPSVSTAPGHYVITVTATTVQGVQRSVKLPLTVQ